MRHKYPALYLRLSRKLKKLTRSGVSSTKPTVVVGDHENCDGMPSSLTPRLVRSEVENKLELPSGTLDSPGYKALVKRTIHDAMVCSAVADEHNIR